MRSSWERVPPLIWIAVVCAGLAVWSQDVRGIYLAVVCAVIGTVQLAVPGLTRTAPVDQAEHDPPPPWHSPEH